MPANQWIFIILFIIFTFRWFFFPHTRSFLLGKILKLTPQGRIKFFQNITNTLETSSTYFRALSPEAKKTFLTRCINFNNSIRYIGMEGLTVTEDMQWRLAAAAVQITFGFKNFSLSHYHTIKIFPETFYSRMHDRYLKGGTSTSGVFFFSWKDFVEGYNDSTDRYNLGLHEMGHALRLQLLHGSDFDDRFADYADKWIDIARPEFESMSSNESAFLRSYAAVNMEEFFAVCVEHFFEVPVEFKKHLPDIYNHLCFLLNQDPSRSNDDYRLSPTFITDINSDSGRKPIPLAIPRNYKYHNWHWSFNVIIVGIFIAFPIIISLYGYVLFRPLHVFLIVALAAAILSGFQNYFQSKGIFLFRHLMLFATMGVGMILAAVLFYANKKITGNFTRQTLNVKSYIFNRGFGDNPDSYLLILDGDAYKNYSSMRTFSGEDVKKLIPYVDSVQFTFSKGILGLTNFEHKKLIINRPAKVPETP